MFRMLINMPSLKWTPYMISSHDSTIFNRIKNKNVIIRSNLETLKGVSFVIVAH